MRLLSICLIGFISSLSSAQEEKQAGGRPASFEEALSGARPVTTAELAELVEPLFADCKRPDDDLAARQCASVRDWLVGQLRDETFVDVGDDSAIALGPFDAGAKQVELEVEGCLACKQPIPIGERTRFITTRVPKSIKAGRVAGLEVGFHELPFKDAGEAAVWRSERAPRLKAQFVFRVGPVWKSGNFEGVTFIPVAHRVIDKCNGKVFASEPPSTGDAAPMRDGTCPEELSDAERRAREEAALPDQLSPKQINLAMAPMKLRVRDCYREFEATSPASVRLVVERDGKIDNVAVLPPYDKTPAGYCIRNQIRAMSFPRFRGDKMIINYAFTLQ
jgi:hypothetical protein